MKRFHLGLFLGILILLLAGCGGEDKVLMEMEGEDEFTESDYIDMMSEIVTTEQKRGMVLDHVVKQLATEELSDKIYEQVIEYTSLFSGEEDNLTDEEKEMIRQQADLEAGLVELYKEAELFTEDEVKEEFGEGKKEYVVRSVSFEQAEDILDDVKKIMENEDSEVISEKLGEFDIYVSDSGNVPYNEYLLPVEFLDVMDEDTGFVGVKEVDPMVYVYKLEEVRDVEYEDIRKEIIFSLVQNEDLDYLGLIRSLEDKEKIKLTKELRDIIGIDEDLIQ